MAKTIRTLCFFLFFLSVRNGYTQNIQLIPQVDSLSRKEGSLSLKQLKGIDFLDVWEESGMLWIESLKELAGLSVERNSAEASIHLEQVKMQTPEAYTLEINRQGVFLKAGDRAGINHAFSTFLQLLMQSKGQELPLLIIHDKPRFHYRGIMIDCSRHFWTVEQLKKDIRQMAFFKFNTLHLHLTDNQGWRLFLEKYPELAEKGSFYRNFKDLSGNYYRKSELQELIRYAAAYGIEIIPEVDIPGHCQALLAALPELSCKGGTFEVYPEEEDGNERKRRGENMVCIGNPDTYRFVDDLVTELAALFPSSVVHMGGDEVSTHIWEQCPKCQELYKKKKMTSWHELQDYFTKKVSQIVRSKGKQMMGWDEINDRDAAVTDDRIMVWQRDGMEQQRKAVERGLSVVMSPKDPCYFDFGYSRNSTRRVYEWEPVGKDLSAAQAALIKGGQANLWTEFVITQKEKERMLYPRACALAETLWNAPEKKEWNDFLRRITAFDDIFRRLDIHCFANEDWDNPGFVPQQEYTPRLVCPAQIETDISGIKYYVKEYAFDGDKRTFFSTPYSLDKGAYFTLVLDEVQTTQKIGIVFDASKEHPEHVRLSISTDGKQFKTVSATNRNGELLASFEKPVSVKAVKIELTEPLMARLSIKEFILH